MLRKRTSEGATATRLLHQLGGASGGLTRGSFLERSGLAAGGLTGQEGPVERRKTVCPFCAVGCSIWAEVQNGVWIGQEPVFESPVNMGTHCANGAATRELVIGERRLKYPTKLAGGRWERVGWEQAIDEIGDRLLQFREHAGPDAVYWLGSAKFSNEQAYYAASSPPSGAPTTSIARRASATRPQSPA